MIRIEKTEVLGMEAAIRGMRNPMNSWGLSDSETKPVGYGCGTRLELGSNDHRTMLKLAKGGPVHGKYKRMIQVYCDITAPLYWWKEFDTYKVGTVANSCSTMHKIHDKEFELSDFSCEHLITDQAVPTKVYSPMDALCVQITILNTYRELFNSTGDKLYWWQMIQLLPSSYNQKRTVMLNYEVLTNILASRKSHKLDEWHGFCEWILGLPCSEIIEAKKEYE